MLEALVRTGAIAGLVQSGELGSGTQTQLARASPGELEEANRRYGIIRPYLDGERISGELAPARTVYDWLKKYRTAEALYGNGLLGLIPRTHESGNRTTRLPELTRTLMRDFIENQCENLRQKTRCHVYGALVRACEAQDTPAPSYKTFTLEIARRPQYEQVLNRKGHRAAYQLEPCYLELDCNTPRHGDRPPPAWFALAASRSFWPPDSQRIHWSWRRGLNPRPSDYKAETNLFYLLLPSSVNYYKSGSYGHFQSARITPNFYHFLPRVPKKVPIVKTVIRDRSLGKLCGQRRAHDRVNTHGFRAPLLGNRGLLCILRRLGEAFRLR